MKKLFIFLLMIAPLAVFSQSYQLSLQGTRQIGKGFTGIAQPTDATSLYTNPGSSVFLKENDINLSISPALVSGRFTNKNTNRETKANVPVQTPFSASAIFGNPEGKWRFGINVNTPYGLTNRWEKNSGLRFEITKITLLSIAIQPTVSYKITDRLGIGAGFIYAYGHVNLQRDLPLQFMDGTFGSSRVLADAYGLGVNAGIFYKISDKVNVGFTYRSPMDMKTSSGTAKFKVPDVARPNFPNQKIRAELPLSSNYSLGVSYKPAIEWVVNFDAVLSDWHRYDVISIKFKEAPVNGMDAEELIRNYHQGYSFRLGAEYLPEGKKYELRAGIVHNRTPIPDDLVNPDVPDANRVSFAAGASYKFNSKFRADLSLLYEPIHNNGTNRLTGIDGTYNYDLFFPSVGLTYKY